MSHPFAQKLVSDARVFDDWGRRIAAGDWWGRAEVFDLPPLYAYLLGVFYWVVGYAPKGVVVMQVLLGVGSAVLVYRLGRRHFGVWVGLFAGVLFAGYGPQLFYEGMLLGNSGAVFLCLLGVTVLDEGVGQEEDAMWYWWVGGVVFGLVALMRPNVLSAVPFLLFGVWWMKRQDWGWQEVRRPFVLFVGVLMVPLLVCGLRNGLMTGDWVLITSHGGINFYMGNHVGAPGWFSAPEGVDAQITPDGVLGNLEGTRQVAEGALGRSLKASEVSGYWFGKGLDFVVGHPVDALGGMIHKTRLFLSGYEIPLNYNFYYQRQYARLLQIPITELWVVFPLAFIGMCVALRQFDRHALLYLWGVGYAVGVVLFHVSSRYRMPVVPFVMLFAAYGGWMVVVWVRSRSWRSFGLAMGALVVLWAGYRVDLDGWKTGSNLGQDPFNLGTSYLWANENERALTFLEEAEGYGQGDGALYYNLGLTYGRLDQKDKAKWAYREALRKDADMVTAYVNLGNIWFHEGDYHKAIGLYREALKRDDLAHNARANMGWALYSVGKEGEAREAWERVLRVVPGHRSAVVGMERIGR